MSVIIYGTGNEGTIAYDIASEQNKEVIGFVDDFDKNQSYLNKPILGTGKDLKQLLKKHKAKLIVAIGKHQTIDSFEGNASTLKEKIYSNLEEENLETLIHPFTSISKLAKIGSGSIIHTGVTIEPNTEIGKGCIINNGSKICHDIKIGNYTHIAPKVTIAGRVNIGKNSWIGTGTTILDGINIGNNCFIGAGSLVLKNIPDNTLAYGSPAVSKKTLNIPMSSPEITEQDIESVIAVLKSKALSLGSTIPKFEQEFAKFIGVKYATAVSSGTAGLHLTCLSLNLKPGDEVITSPFSFIASANAIHYTGAKPVFADIDETNFNLDPKEIRKAITPKTKAILPVHIFGEACDMSEIIKIAEQYSLEIIEDACESTGTDYNGKKVGTFGKAGVFAFYPNKQITTGEGGIIVTNDKELDNYFKSMRNQGRSDENLEWLNHSRIGYNYRLSDIHASLGLSQLSRIEKILETRNQKADLYTSLLKETPEIILPLNTKGKTWFVYVIRLSQNIDRNKVIQEMKHRNIPTKPYLPSIHLQEAYKKHYGYTKGHMPISEKVSESTLALPFFTEITPKEINRVVTNLKEVLENETIRK